MFDLRIRFNRLYAPLQLFLYPLLEAIAAQRPRFIGGISNSRYGRFR
jgi:hypothetical protein